MKRSAEWEPAPSIVIPKRPESVKLLLMPPTESTKLLFLMTPEARPEFTDPKADPLPRSWLIT